MYKSRSSNRIMRKSHNEHQLQLMHIMRFAFFDLMHMMQFAHDAM